MPKPRRSTRDEWLDQFADFDAASQEALIETCELLHRQTRRREARAKPEADERETLAQEVSREIGGGQ